MALNNAANDGNRTIHGVFVAQGANTPNYLVLTDGQLLIGNTGSDPTATTLTAGTGINIANGAGGITITNTAPGVATWSTQTTTGPVNMVAEHGYSANSTVGPTVYNLPALAAVGDTFIVAGVGTGNGWSVNVSVGQTIQLGNQVATVGLASTDSSDSVTLVCLVANTTFTTLSPIGNITYV